MKVTIQKNMALNETTMVELDFTPSWWQRLLGLFGIEWDVVREAYDKLDARFLEMNRRALIASGNMRDLFKKNPEWYNAAMDAQAVLFGQPVNKLTRDEIENMAAEQSRLTSGTRGGGNNA